MSVIAGDLSPRKSPGLQEFDRTAQLLAQPSTAILYLFKRGMYVLRKKKKGKCLRGSVKIDLFEV